MSSAQTSAARVLAMAAEIFGSRQAAEAWLSKPALGLDWQRPVDLLATEPGSQIVVDFLVRLDYGVYS